MFFSIFQDRPKRHHSPVGLTQEDAMLIEVFAHVVLEWELCLNEARILLGVAHLDPDVCRRLNAKERSPSDEERKRMHMLAFITKMLGEYFARKGDAAMDRKERKFWCNMDSKKWLQQYVLPHASVSAWDMLMIGKFEDIKLIEEAVRAETQ